MARKPRNYIVGMTYYIYLTGNNGEKCFFDDSCYSFYLTQIMTSAEMHGVPVHSYVLLPTRALVVVTPRAKESLPGMMKASNVSYASFLSRIYGRSGTVWNGRYKSAPIHSEKYLLDLQKYVELLPVIDGQTEHPGQYIWSSYTQNALGASRTLKPHLEYMSLGNSLHERCTNYRSFIDSPSVRCNEISELVSAGHPLMDGSFLRTINPQPPNCLPTRLNHYSPS